MKTIEAFISLIDANAPLARYKRELGFSLNEFRIQLKYVRFYRLYIQMSKEVAELAKQKAGKTTLEKARINNEIRQLRTHWRPILKEAKRISEN